MQHEVAALEMVTVLILLLFIVVWDTVDQVRWIPNSVVAVVLGMLVAAWSDSEDAPFVFAPELFLYLLLPVILLSSALRFRPESLRRTWLSSMMFAWLGTLLSIVLIAWGIDVWTSLFGLDMSFVDALLVASLLASNHYSF